MYAPAFAASPATRSLAARLAHEFGPAVLGVVGGNLVQRQFNNDRSPWDDALGGAVKGVGIGATVGSYMPIVGTGLGAAIGGVGGGLLSLIGAAERIEQTAPRTPPPRFPVPQSSVPAGRPWTIPSQLHPLAYRPSLSALVNRPGVLDRLLPLPPPWSAARFGRPLTFADVLALVNAQS